MEAFDIASLPQSTWPIQNNIVSLGNADITASLKELKSQSPTVASRTARGFLEGDGGLLQSSSLRCNCCYRK